MARKSREKSATGVYHVMMRGTNKQNIFEDTDDYIRFISILRSMVYPIDDMRKPLPPRCPRLCRNGVHYKLNPTLWPCQAREKTHKAQQSDI